MSGAGVAVRWGDIHVGDTVRGRDQRVWVVTMIEPGPNWIVGGGQCTYTLQLGERVITTDRKRDDLVEAVSIADHRVNTTAVQALIAAGYHVEIISEGEPTVSETTEDLQGMDAPGALLPATAAPDGGTGGGAMLTGASIPTNPDQFTGVPQPIKRDRWKRYLLPNPDTGEEMAWTRVSTVARTLADEYSLNAWRQRMVAKGMSLRPDLVTLAASADPDDERSVLNDVVRQADEAAATRRGANLGTAFHALTQRLDMGEPYDTLVLLVPSLAPQLDAYRRCLKLARLSVPHGGVERVVGLSKYGVAGTLDRTVFRDAGELDVSILDIKSGKTVEYSWLEWAIQQAMYANADLLWNPVRQCWEPFGGVNRDRALICHVPIAGEHAGTATLYGLDIRKGWAAAEMAMQVRDLRKEAEKGLMSWLIEPDDPAALALHNVSRAGSQAELAKLWDTLHPAGRWTTEVNNAAAQRWEYLNQTGQL